MKKNIIRTFLWLQTEYDSYEEWFEIIASPELKYSKKFADESNNRSDSKYYLIKQELEKIFKRREEITLEELHEYVEGILKPQKRGIYILICYL